MSHLMVLAEFVFTEEGEAAFAPHLDRTMEEMRSLDGCLQAVLWSRPGRRYQFSTLWTDADAVKCWVDHDFHRSVLVPGFRKWCTEGCFGEYRLVDDHERARKCGRCGRWTRALPGWNESGPSACGKCDAPLARPADLSAARLAAP